MENPNISYFAKVNFRKDGRAFGIFQDDRLLHTYVLGKTGSGKTNLLTTIILQDIKHGRGCAVFDVHGDLMATIKNHIPKQRTKDIVHLDIADPAMNYRYNPLKRVSPEKRSLVVGGLLDVFEKQWGSAWGAKLEHILRYILLTLLHQREANIGSIVRIIHDEPYRNACLQYVSDKDILRFWRDEYPKYSKNDILPILNKVGAFLAHPSIKRFLMTNKRDISLRRCMDSKKIVLVDISKGKLGIDVSSLVGALLITSFAHGAFSRIDTREADRVPFHIFLDEFQNYTSKNIAGILSELRKFKVSLTLAHQYLYQLDGDIRNAVLGNVGTTIAFRTGHKDSVYLEQEFSLKPRLEASDFTNLKNYDIYLKLMIKGRPSVGFSATTIPYREAI